MIVYHKNPRLNQNPVSRERLWVNINGEQYKVTFKGGRAEVPDNVGDYLCDKGYALRGFETGDGSQARQTALEDLLVEALDKQVVTKRGAWFYFGDRKLGQGMNAAVEFLAANPDTVGQIRYTCQPAEA